MMLWFQMIKVLPYLAYIPILWWGGNRFCKLVVTASGTLTSKSSVATTSGSLPKAGRYIGLLERLLIAIGIVFKSWEVIAAVIALKTVARYKELDDQITAEYFLIGSLASLFWAIVVTIVFSFYDYAYGFHFVVDLLAAMK